MKRFNIANSHFKLDGRKMSIGEIYGNFEINRKDYHYRCDDFKIYTKEVVHYKDIVRKDGTHDVVPQVKKYTYMKIYVYQEHENVWVKYSTSYKPLRELGSFLMTMCHKLGINEKTQVIKYVDNYIPNLPEMRKIPECQYKIDIVGYALDPRIITDDVVSPRQAGYFKTPTNCNTTNKYTIQM